MAQNKTRLGLARPADEPAVEPPFVQVNRATLSVDSGEVVAMWYLAAPMPEGAIEGYRYLGYNMSLKVPGTIPVGQILISVVLRGPEGPSVGVTRLPPPGSHEYENYPDSFEVRPDAIMARFPDGLFPKKSLELTTVSVRAQLIDEPEATNVESFNASAKR